MQRSECHNDLFLFFFDLFLFPRVKTLSNNDIFYYLFYYLFCFPGLKPCATISVMPPAFAEINSVGMADIVTMEFIPLKFRIIDIVAMEFIPLNPLKLERPIL